MSQVRMEGPHPGAVFIAALAEYFAGAALSERIPQKLTDFHKKYSRELIELARFKLGPMHPAAGGEPGNYNK